jgi:hypothetical protein
MSVWIVLAIVVGTVGVAGLGGLGALWGTAAWKKRQEVKAAIAAATAFAELPRGPMLSPDFQFHIVLCTNDGARARKIFERAQVAAKEQAEFWDGLDLRGTKTSTKPSAA